MSAFTSFVVCGAIQGGGVLFACAIVWLLDRLCIEPTRPPVGKDGVRRTRGGAVWQEPDV